MKHIFTTASDNVRVYHVFHDCTFNTAIKELEKDYGSCTFWNICNYRGEIRFELATFEWEVR